MPNLRRLTKFTAAATPGGHAVDVKRPTRSTPMAMTTTMESAAPLGSKDPDPRDGGRRSCDHCGRHLGDRRSATRRSSPGAIRRIGATERRDRLCDRRKRDWFARRLGTARLAGAWHRQCSLDLDRDRGLSPSSSHSASLSSRGSRRLPRSPSSSCTWQSRPFSSRSCDAPRSRGLRPDAGGAAFMGLSLLGTPRVIDGIDGHCLNLLARAWHQPPVPS